MRNPYNFTLTFANQHGGQYMLTIDNLDKFNVFASQYQNSFLLAGIMKIADLKADKTGQNYNSQNELNFLKFLEKTNSGLKMFRSNSTTNSMDPIKHSNGEIISAPCT